MIKSNVNLKGSTEMFKVFNQVWLFWSYKVNKLIQTHFGKLEKCPNCGNVLNYDNDNIAICTCDDYSYHYRA